jgi:hypothetical protein
MEGNAPPPSELRPDVPPGLDAVVLRCLQPQAQARYPSAAALADALTEVMGGSRIDTTEVARLVEEVSRTHDQPTPKRAVHLSALRPMLLDRTPPHALDSGLFNLGDDQRSPPLDAVPPGAFAGAAPEDALEDAVPADALASASIAESAADEQPAANAEEPVRGRRKVAAVAVALGLALVGLLALVVHSRRPSPSSLRALGRGGTHVETATMPHGSSVVHELDRPAAASALQPAAEHAVPARSTGSTGGRGSRPAKRAASPAHPSVRKRLRRHPATPRKPADEPFSPR